MNLQSTFSQYLGFLGLLGVASAAEKNLFEVEVAPLLARHCLECHDGATSEGGLDLSQRHTAMKGGKHGVVIVPGDPASSPLWTSVESGEMPEDRPMLTAEEKQGLKRWIESGAKWTSDVIDPLALGRDSRSTVNWVRRLTVPEYIETVRVVTGLDIGKEARSLLPPDKRADGFTNTAYNLTVDFAHVSAASRLAAIIAHRIDVKAFMSGLTDGRKVDFTAPEKWIPSVGAWVFRGPLDGVEEQAFLKLAGTVTKGGGDQAEVLLTVLTAMLQSPRFLYRMEDHRGDGNWRRANPYEVASRLSYLIVGGPPDQDLLRAAGRGDLGKESPYKARIARLLDDPRAVAQSQLFISDWLNMDRLNNLSPDAKRFPSWTPDLAQDMRHETLETFRVITWEERRPLVELINAPFTFLTPRLARHYGLSVEPMRSAKTRNGEQPERVSNGLLSVYHFNEGQGELIIDHGPMKADLRITNSSMARWSEDGLTVEGAAGIMTPTPPLQLIGAIRSSNEVSVDLWVTPADNRQNGPARVMSWSEGHHDRNIAIGQERDRWDVRLRTTKTNSNGQPSVGGAGGIAGSQLVHLVLTRDKRGNVQFYVDGKSGKQMAGRGDLSNWSDAFLLYFGDESTGDRTWRGTFHSVLIYGRSLTENEVMQNHSAGPQGNVWLEHATPVRYDLSETPERRGLLTQGSVLTIGGDEGSMVARGLFVLHDLLHSAVGSAPPGTDTTPVPPKKGQSHRAVSELRLANVACTGCHSKFEPLAFAFEKFDGLGGYRDKDEHGNSLREDGQALVPGEKGMKSYQTTAEFLNIMASSERVAMTFTRKLAQFALGRPLIESDLEEIAAIHSTSKAAGHTYQSLIQAIASSRLITHTRTVSPDLPQSK